VSSDDFELGLRAVRLRFGFLETNAGKRKMQVV
jgi:hypothetical protein